MLSSATDVDCPVGLGVSGACSILASHLSQTLTDLGKRSLAFDLSGGQSDSLEHSALAGKLSAVIELGLEDYILEVVSGRAATSNRLTAAIKAHLPQVWLLMPLSETCATIRSDELDAAGKRLAWLASAADPHPTVIVVAGSPLTDLLAESFHLWALASVPVHHTTTSQPHELAAVIIKCLG